MNLSDLFSHIINGSLLKKKTIKIKKSKKFINILNLLNNEGLIRGFKYNDFFIIILLKYSLQEPIIKKITSISKPSKKIYVGYKDIQKLSKCIYILSTTKGFLTNYKALEKKLGGEVICKIIC